VRSGREESVSGAVELGEAISSHLGGEDDVNRSCNCLKRIIGSDRVRGELEIGQVSASALRMSVAAPVEVLENAIRTGRFWDSATDGTSNAVSRNRRSIEQGHAVPSDDGMENYLAWYSGCQVPIWHVTGQVELRGR
jgi:hypothetical protein